MKLSIFVLACLMASALSNPVTPNQLKSLSTTTTTTPAPIESKTIIKSTDAPSTLSSGVTIVAEDDSTTDNAKVTTAAIKQQSTEPSTTAVSSAKPKVENKVESAPIAVENTKKFPDARKGRGSKKFDTAKHPVEKPMGKPVEKQAEKIEEVRKEETPEAEHILEEEPKDEEVDEEKPEVHEENLSEQKLEETNDDDESISAVSSGKTVPAVVQSRILSAEERRKGRKYKDIRIVQLESEMEDNGKYHFSYENEDGTIVQQSGEMKMMDNSDGEKMMGESVVGAYSYKDDDGNTISISYTADENGFRPVGSHIPTIPPAIARSLAWQATAKPWVDPWIVEQEKLRKARKLKSKSDEEKMTNIA